MNPQRSNLQYYHWETYIDQKMIKIYGQHTQFNVDSQEESPPIPSIHGKAIPIISTAIRMVNENSTQSNAWRQTPVLCVDGRNKLQIGNQRERESEPPGTIGKTFLFLVLHEEDERPRTDGVGRKGSHIVERRASVAWQQSSCQPIAASTNKKTKQPREVVTHTFLP